jgi:hypothetical protein
VAFDKAQNHSSPSSGANVLTSSDTTAPTTPASMAISYTSTTSVRMTWTASTDSGGSGIQGYRVYRDGLLISPLLPGATRMYVDTTLATNTPYTYEIRGVDNVGNEGSGISRSVFRDDFDRAAGTGMNSPFWATSGSWILNSNQAYMAAGSTCGCDALATKSFASFTGSFKTINRGSGSNTTTSSGMVFWSNDAGTEKYLVTMAGTPFNTAFTLQYVTPSQTYTLQTATYAVAPYMVAVDADATSREIKVSFNGFSKFSTTYTETDTGRRNSGKIGIRATLASGENVRADEFVVTEKGGSLTSTDIVPPNVRLTYLSGTSVQVDWDPSADIGTGIAGYEVFRGATLVSGGSLLTATTFQNSGLSANTAYTYTVKAVDTPGTRYASVTKSAFRDDFNRASLLANSGWSSAGNWGIVSNKAETSSFTLSDVLTSSSVGSFRATATLTMSSNSYGGGIGGIVFWSNGTEGYRADNNGLSYFTASGSQVVASSGIGSGTIRVEANTNTRTINVYQNNTLTITYVETTLSRRNTGKVGVTGYIAWNPEYSEYCYMNPECAFTTTADDFFVEEQ